MLLTSVVTVLVLLYILLVRGLLIWIMDFWYSFYVSDSLLEFDECCFFCWSWLQCIFLLFEGWIVSELATFPVVYPTCPLLSICSWYNLSSLHSHSPFFLVKPNTSYNWSYFLVLHIHRRYSALYLGLLVQIELINVENIISFAISFTHCFLPLMQVPRNRWQLTIVSFSSILLLFSSECSSSCLIVETLWDSSSRSSCFFLW